MKTLQISESFNWEIILYAVDKNKDVKLVYKAFSKVRLILD